MIPIMRFSECELEFDVEVEAKVGAGGEVELGIFSAQVLAEMAVAKTSNKVKIKYVTTFDSVSQTGELDNSQWNRCSRYAESSPFRSATKIVFPNAGA